MALENPELEELKPMLTFDEELKMETKVTIDDDTVSSDEDEFTDDECFLERHRI